MGKMITVAVSVFATLCLLILSQSVIGPQKAHQRTVLTDAIDFDALFAAVSDERVGRIHGRAVSVPSRLSGTPGERALSQWVEQEFSRLGLEVVVQRFAVTVPVTKWCTIQEDRGRDLPGITLAPFWPNVVRTCTTDPEGIVGTVIDAGSGSMKDLDGKQILGNIALVTMKPGLAWLDAAKLGAKAILFRPTSDPRAYRDKALGFPADLPRFLITGPADDLVGKRVRLNVRVDWEIREAQNVFGLLRPSVTSAETLSILAYTDSWSTVPDLAPGYHDACSTATLVAMARALSEQRQGLARMTVFAALSGHYQTSEGSRRMIDAMGARTGNQENKYLLDRRLAESSRRLANLIGAGRAIEETDYWELSDLDEEQLWKQHGPAARDALSSVVGQLIGRYVIEAKQDAEQARVLWKKADQPAAGPLFDAQQRSANQVRRATAAGGVDIVGLKRDFGSVLTACRARKRMRQAVADARTHAEAAVEYQKDAIKVSELLRSETSKLNYFFFLAPSGSGQHLGYRGDLTLCSDLERARDTIVGSWLRWRGMSAEDSSIYANYMTNHQRFGDNRHIGKSYTARWSPPAANLVLDPAWVLYRAGYGAFEFSGNVYPEAYQTPLDRRVNIPTLTGQAQLLTGLVAQVASGADPMDVPGKAAAGIVMWFSDFGGQVMSVGGANALLPDQPVSDALVVLKTNSPRGARYVQKTRDGSFRFHAVDGWTIGHLMADAYSLDGSTGQITGARDLGAEGERFPTLVPRGKLVSDSETRVLLLLARMKPVDIYRTIGPKGRPLTLDVIDARFRATPPEYSLSEYWEQGATVFMKPGEKLYLLMKDLPMKWGQPQKTFSEKGYFTRGFLLANRTDRLVEADENFWGPGYLVGDDRRVVYQDVDAAISVAYCNRQRLASQTRTGLADAVNVQLAHEAEQLLGQGLEAFKAEQYDASYRDLVASLAISLRAYPAVRAALYDAVSGIMLYLFLLVPFSFFAERLLFGFNDIRSRLAGMFVVFLLMFLVIRFTHPAYELMTSSLIVLVGFVIFMLCVLILGFVVGKFVEQVRGIRQIGSGMGESETDVSRLSASGTAFNLGISNMRKRKVRTAYTVATLVLISFCLVCFTAPRPQLRDRQMAIGSAAFNGVVLRDPGDIEAARLRFADTGKLIARRTVSRNSRVVHTPDDRPVRISPIKGLVYVESAESLVTHLDEAVLPGGKWFQPGQEGFCYLSDMTADQLGIDPGRVLDEAVYVTIGGRRLSVRGVFDSTKVDALRDADGESFLPDLASNQSNQQRQQETVKQLVGRPDAQQTSAQYIPAAELAILPLGPDAGGEFDSAVVQFYDQAYGDMREKIGQIMDGAPTFVRYAIDGLAFFGARLRSVGVEGYVDIVVPLLVASCIVFNTMLGNVHERKKEISIYSAIGLSPRHVFYLFLAESLVYAVIGVVGGYLLALSLQGLSQLGGGFLGLSIDYSSRSAIYVCLTLMVAVIVSSFVPAYQAARVASPSERVTWKLPHPIAFGQLRFDLPFTYLGQDILAAVPFLIAWFDAHGDDSSGLFSASEPQVQVDWSETGPLFSVASTVWLRPYDLGVSEQVQVTLGPSDEPNIYAVTVEIDLLTGSDTAWRRTNARFVSLLRRHLLGWRALSGRRKEILFEQATVQLGLSAT